MEWKTVNNYPDYAINSKGSIKSLRYDRLLKPSMNSSGYLYVNLLNNKIRKTTSVHKLVMEHFGPEKPSIEVIIDHKDGDKTNSCISNLQWLSIKENTEKFYGNGDKKIEALKLHAQGKKLKEISEIVGLSYYIVRETILKSV
jgi:hypothetical protein